MGKNIVYLSTTHKSEFEMLTFPELDAALHEQSTDVLDTAVPPIRTAAST